MSSASFAYCADCVKFAISTQQVRVFQVEVAPHASTLLHHHGHDYLFVTLGEAHVSNEVLGYGFVVNHMNR